MIFWREIQFTRCNNSAVSIGNNIFPNGIIKFQQYRRFIFPEGNYKDGPLNLLFLFGHIWDLGFRFA
jgi:hypothetical protein